MQKKSAEFKERNIQLVGLSYDSVKTLATFAKTKNVNFPLLSDEGSKTIKALGLEYQRGLPFPGTVFIATDGTVKGKLFDANYKVRPSAEDLLKKADEVVPAKEAAAAK